MAVKIDWRFSALMALCLASASCAPAVGVRSLRPEAANLALTANVLNSGEPSPRATEFLHRANLDSQFDKSPAATLAALHASLGQRDESDRLYALAELSFAHAERSGDRRYFLGAAVYAWIFLFGSEEAQRPSRYDPRVRVAMDLYNRGIADGLTAPGTRQIDVRPRQEPLPFGTLNLDLDHASLDYGGSRLERFTSLVGLQTHGFRNRYRRRGIGAPIAASVVRSGDAQSDKRVGPHAKVPRTLLLRLENAREGLASGQVRARMELLDVETGTTTQIGSEEVPVEAELSAALAFRLQDSPLWDFEIAGFRRGDLVMDTKDSDNLYVLHPYVPGRIPVVFVHGTASSPARWAEMTNELMNDPVLGSRYQFWFFLYNTGNPVAYSASRLRRGLTNAVADMDPQGQDPALRKVVVIGHSQGGLLTKLTAVSSGNRFWENVSDRPFDEVKLSPETREIVQEGLFFEPVPSVRRLIFIATPHHGAMMAGNFFGNIARRLVSLPGRMVGASLDLVTLRASGAISRITSIPTSIDNMTSTNPFLVTLSQSPVAPGVTAHSIVAVKGKGEPSIGNDGVVAYKSAHLDGVESELIVRSSHSTQAIPETIEEVRRILYLHLDSQ